MLILKHRTSPEWLLTSLSSRGYQQQSEKKTWTQPDIDCYQPAVPYRRLCAYKTWHHLQCHLRPPWSGHCERIKKVLWVDQPIWLFCRIVNKLRNMLTVVVSHLRALDVVFWWENKSSYWFGATSGIRERMHLMSAYLQSNISSESFFNQTRSPASTPGHAQISLN